MSLWSRHPTFIPNVLSLKGSSHTNLWYKFVQSTHVSETLWNHTTTRGRFSVPLLDLRGQSKMVVSDKNDSRNTHLQPPQGPFETQGNLIEGHLPRLVEQGTRVPGGMSLGTESRGNTSPVSSVIFDGCRAWVPPHTQPPSTFLVICTSGPVDFS